MIAAQMEEDGVAAVHGLCRGFLQEAAGGDEVVGRRRSLQRAADLQICRYCRKWLFAEVKRESGRSSLQRWVPQGSADFA